MKTSYIPFPVHAGFPSPALDYMEERINLNDVLIQHPLATFIIECTGDSMINAFIPMKAKLVVDRSLTPKNNDIVLAVLNGEFTVKYLKKNDCKCWLVPANRKYPSIQVTEEMHMQVWGVVTHVISDVKDLKACML
ncbi:MAG TPA: translesion error-prone DNA polymerase V autoproteolytic subunit [Chitinophagaceae bacterium]|nr:translesion error-prone DNA polymerase V autoproteolytic subunit [Chitinophagaceae bacterium]